MKRVTGRDTGEERAVTQQRARRFRDIVEKGAYDTDLLQPVGQRLTASIAQPQS